MMSLSSWWRHITAGFIDFLIVEELFHLIHQIASGVQILKREVVLVDQHLLKLLPFGPSLH